MGSLSNLYISQSFTSLLHLGNDGPVTNLAPGQYTQFQDGLGNSLGISVNSSGDISSSGYIYATNIFPTITTASFNQYTQSTNIRLTNIESTTASLNSSVSQLNASSASQQVSINALNTFTASQSTASIVNSITNLNNFTSSANGRLNNIESTTASLNSSVSQLNASSASQQISINNLNTTTASLLVETQNLELFSASALVSISNLNASSASQQVSINALNVFTASQSTASIVTSITNLNSFTSSANSRLNNIETTTASLLVETQNLELFSASALTSISNLNASSASQQISINSLNSATSSYVTETESGSFLLTASFDNGTRNLTFTKGNNTTFNVNIPDVSGSIINTGSFMTTGSVNVNVLTFTKADGSTFDLTVAASGSVVPGTISGSAQITALGFVSSSVTASSLITASFNNGTRNITFTKGNGTQFDLNIPAVSDGQTYTLTSSFNAYTASNDQRVSSLESTTASLLIETQNLELFSASALVSISNLNASSASQQVSINALNSATQSLFVSASLALVTASVNNDDITFTKGDGSQFTIQVATGSFAISASFAETASFALNGGVTQILAGPNIIVSPLSGQGQVTISSTGTGSGGFNTATGSYGSFYDTTIQTNPVANSANSMSFNETAITNGVSISGSTSPFNTYIKTENAGIYNLQFSAQLDKTDSGTDSVDIWIRKNGIDLLDTGTTITLTNNNTKTVAAWNWFVQSAANDYYQIIWSSADTDLRLFAEASSSVHPGIPSVIATVNRVDQFLSNTGSFSGSFTGTFNGYNLTEFTTTSSFNSYTSSTNSRLTNIESTTASLLIETQNLELFSASALSSISQLNASSASQQISINNLNTTTASLLIETQNLELFSASALTSLSNLNTATASLFTSASLSLTTASFSGNTLTFTKGNGTTFGVVIPDVSGSTINTGSFATTGSNSFNGSQTITGSITSTQDITISGVKFGFGNPAGTASIAIGNNTLQNNTFDNNIAIGDDALKENTVGSRNIGIGVQALKSITGNSNYNVGIGSFALSAATSSTNTFALGYAAMESAVDSNENIAIGVAALANKKANSNQNTAIGSHALREHRDGDTNSGQNMAFGYDTMRNVTSGSANTAIGAAALRDAGRANENVFIGWISGINASGSIDQNVVIGPRAAQKIAGNSNTIIGHNAGTDMVNGGANIFIGQGAGALIVTGSSNTLIGSSLSGVNNWSNVIAISDGAGAIKTKFQSNIWEFTGSVDIQNTLTASLQQGFTYVGNASGKTIAVSTASFASTINTASFATTGSNTFTGINTFTNEIRPNTYIRFPNDATLYGNSGSRFSVDSNTGMQFRNFTTSEYFFEQYANAQMLFYNRGGERIEISGSATRIQDVDFIPFSASLNTRINAITGSSIDTGSFATTGSNTFTGDQTLVDNAGNFFTISDASGSLMLVAKGYTSASAHLSASAAGIGNIIFKTNNNTPDTIISGSNNIFTNANAPQVGLKRYVGGSNNIINTVSLPQISGSMQFSPGINQNYIVGQINMRGPVSSSAWNITSNNVQGAISVGTSAANHAQGIVSGLNISTNSILGGVNIIANRTNTTLQFGIATSQFLGGTTSINANSSSIQMTANLIGGANTINNNTTGSNRVSVQGNGFNFTQNIMMGGNTITASGSNDPNDTGDLDFNANIYRSLILGNSNAIQLQGGLTGSNSMVATSVIGNNLIVTGSSPNPQFASTTSNAFGSEFIGRFNAVDGNRAKSAETIFAVGTGTSTSNRKTGFLIDSGSNSFFEGTVNISGSLLVNGVAPATINTASFATTGSNLFVGNQTITGSVSIKGNTTFTSVGNNTTNIILGSSALGNATSANNSVAIGENALLNTTTGNNNFALGNQAMYANTTGYQNVAMGVGALYNNTTGFLNVAIGNDAMISCGTASFQNVAIGSNALKVAIGNNNFGLGANALENNTGNANIALGQEAGRFHSGSSNVLVGQRAGQYLTGSANTIIGGYEGVTGSVLNNNIIFADGVGNVRAQYSGSAWSFQDDIKFNKGSNKTCDIVTVGSSGLTVSNSLVTTNSIILATTQNSEVGGDEYPAVVSSKGTGTFGLSHNYGGNLLVAYLIINPT